jgi:CheY-like chemotaxis protein/HPt (histidine-containing phosphotransfer) domain-containing protein
MKKALQESSPRAMLLGQNLVCSHSCGSQVANEMRILVAEDADMTRDLMLELLARRGHFVMAAADGREVLAALSRQSFDVVLMDEEMPHMNGLEATRTIRQMEIATGKHQIVIGMTGNATQEDERRYLEAGMDATLPKPVPIERLLQVIESRTRAPRQSAPGQAYAPPEDLATHLRGATGGNEKLVRSLVKTFLADAPKTLSAIRSAIRKNDAETLARAAHSLKGTLSIFDARKAVAAARNLEAMGRAGNLQAAGNELRALEMEFTQLERDLLALLSETKTAARFRHEH